MQPSSEIRDLVLRSFQWTAAKDLASLVATATREPVFIMIGTAPNEWMTSVAAAEPMVRASVEASSGRVPDDLVIEAYQEGSVGWAAIRWSSKLPTGASIPLRQTVLFHQEGGTWKLVHVHASVAIPDEKVPSII